MPGRAYEIISSTNVLAPLNTNYWISEGVWLAESTNLPAFVPVGSRTNQNFFMAHVWTGFSYGVPTNGQLYLLLSNTNSIQGIVNGVTNTITPVYSNWAVVGAPIYDANFGYDHSDAGDTNFLKDFPQQNIRAVLGVSKTISNLCLAYNPITNIDTHGWPKLQYLEAWHATNLIAANVTNCSKLYRVCFESIEDVGGTTNGIVDVLDFTGCTNLADLRAANNNITNIVFGLNGGSNVWRFCTRDVRNRPANPNIVGVPFASLPSLRELWIWGDNSYADNIYLAATNCPKLESVQAGGNYFQSASFHGQTNLYEALLDQNRMTNLVISGCSNLTRLTAYNNLLGSAAVDSVLITLDQMGKSNGTVVLSSDGGSNPIVNGVPSMSGQQAIAHLIQKGWDVLTNTADSATPQITGVEVSRGSNSAVITWTTANVPSDSTVHWGPTTNYTSTTNDDRLVTSHSVTILGLATNTTYHFAVASTAGANTGTSGDNQFTTLGAGTNTAAIWFTNTSPAVSMQVTVSSGATVTWVWGDSTVSNGMTIINSKNLGSTSHSNAVVVDPASALTGFGLYNPSCNDSTTTTLSGVGGLTNYPNLQDLYLYRSGVTSLSLAGCSNLVSIALVATSPTTNMLNAWFNDLANAQPAMPGGSVRMPCGDLHVFYFPTDPPTNSTSAVACSNLTHQPSGSKWALGSATLSVK